MRRIRVKVVSFALIAGSAVLAATGASAAGWLPVQTVPTVPSGIAVDADGNAVIVGITDGEVQATVRSFGGSWGLSTTLAVAGDTLPSKPKVTVDRGGNAVAVWSVTNAGDRLLRVASRPAAGAWTVPIAVSDGTSPDGNYALATDGQGVTTVIWSEFSGGPGGVYRLKGVSRPTAGPWTDDLSDAFTLPSSPEGSATSPDVAAGADGTVTVAWTAPGPDPEDPNFVWASRRRPADPTWTLNDVSDGGLVRDPQVVVDRNGASTVIWDRAGSPEPTVRGASHPAGPGVAWSLTGPLGTGTEGDIAVAPDGALTLVWLDSYTAGSAIQARTKPIGGSWGTTVDLATSFAANALRHPEVAIDAAGDATAIWGRFDPVNATAEVARRVDGTWRNEQAPLPVGELTAVPVGALDPRGHATMAWTAPTALPGASSIFDPVAPELRDLAVPRTGVVGTPVPVSVQPHDIGAVATTWTFAGQQVGGATASLVFPRPGVHTITVIGEDEAGNRTQLSTTITITDPVIADPPYVPGPGPDPKPGPSPDPKGTAPALSDLKQASARWTVRKRRGSRVPVGTSFRFQLDRAAKVRLSFEQLVPGRRSGKRCVASTARNRKQRVCTRVVQRGSLSAAGKRGANGVEFRGKVGGRTLKPGRYRVRVTATADGSSSKTATRTFTIVR